MERLLTPQEAAEFFPAWRGSGRTTPKAIWYWTKYGVKVGDRRIKLRCLYTPGRRVYRESDLEAFVAEITAAKQLTEGDRAGDVPRAYLESEGVLQRK